MPFKSKKQRAYLWANEPEVAAEFAAHTPKGAKLPMKKESMKEKESKGMKKEMKHKKEERMHESKGMKKAMKKDMKKDCY